MNKFTVGTVATTLFLFGNLAWAARWNLAECGAEFANEWQAYETAVRKAAPGSPLYLPKPFPKKDSEIISRRFKMGKDLGTPVQNDALLQSLRFDERLVSLGGKVFTAARSMAHPNK